MLVVIACLLSAFSFTAGAAPVTGTTTVPAGQTAFSISLNVNEVTPYAGIQFALTLSDDSAAVFASFTPGVSGAAAGPFVTQDGMHYFSFFTDSNAFPAGTTLAGTLNFSDYTGSQTLTVTVVEMKVFRRVAGADGEQTVDVKESPSYVFTVLRATDGPGNETPGSQNPGGQNPGVSNNETVVDTNPPPLAGLLPFDDVHAGDWFYDDVVYVYENSLMNGTGASKFSPDSSLTRGMIVTILGRQSGVDQSSYPSCVFRDVDNKIYYAPYIEWGRQNDIVLGVGNNEFEPDRAVTRQELTAIIHRYADFAGFTLPETRPYVQFLDEKDIAAYAKDPVVALFSAGVINGKQGNLFDPTGTATRAEAAAMLHRFLVAAEA